MEQTVKIKKYIYWWQSQPILRQQSLCRLYLPTSNYLSLKRNEILFIYKSSEETKQKARDYGNSLVNKQERLEELKKWKKEALIAHEINQKVIEKLMAERKLMYSEEEVLNILYKHTEDLLAGKKVTLEEWFEKFKNK